MLLFSFGGTDEPGELEDDYMGPKVYYSTLGTTGFTQLIEDLGVKLLHLELDQRPENHAYLIAQRPASQAK